MHAAAPPHATHPNALYAHGERPDKVILGATPCFIGGCVGVPIKDHILQNTFSRHDRIR